MLDRSALQAALGEHERVSDAIVMARADASGARRLVAYVLPADGVTMNASELHAWLTQRTSERALPITFVLLDRRVARDALPYPWRSRPELDYPYAEPRTDVERRMATTWADVLGLERVGVDDDFFDLGGNSFLSVDLIARLREQGWQVSARDFFENPTVEGIAAMVVA